MTSANEFATWNPAAENYIRKCEARRARAAARFDRRVKRILLASTVLFLWAATLAVVAELAAR